MSPSKETFTARYVRAKWREGRVHGGLSTCLLFSKPECGLDAIKQHNMHCGERLRPAVVARRPESEAPAVVWRAMWVGEDGVTDGARGDATGGTAASPCSASVLAVQ